MRLPAQFEPIWYVIYTGTQRGWICLPFDWYLCWNCPTQEPEEHEAFKVGPLTLTRPATEQEQADWWDGYDPTP
jgi:hypothetical protein